MSSNRTKPATTVKFLSLPLGKKFRWQGTVYVKTSPLLARDEDSGRSQMMQRAAAVELLDAYAISDIAKSACASQTVLEEYHQVVMSGLDSLAPSAPPQLITPLRQQFEKAFRRAHKKLAN